MARITTPDIPPLWGWLPDPPVIYTRAPVDSWFGHSIEPLHNPPGAQPHSGPQKLAPPTGRHLLTGAPIWQRGEPPLDPLPPFQRHEVVANARHPVTGALRYFRPDQDIADGWEIN